MAIVEDNALVLRSLRYRETSRITTMLTERFGKVTVIGKGARDIKSPFGASLEPLTAGQIVFYLKPNRTLHLLRAAWVDHLYSSTLADPEGYHLATAALEFIYKILPDEDPCPEVFSVLTRFLSELDVAPGSPRAAVLFKAFQLRIVSLLGYTPQVDECAGCGRSTDQQAGFGVAEGGLICKQCPGRSQVLPVSADSLRMLRAILGIADQRGGGGPLSPEQTNAVADRSDLHDQLSGGAPVNSPPPTFDPMTFSGGYQRDSIGLDYPQSLRRVDREVVAVIESFLRYHVIGYKGLRSLRSLSAWIDFRESSFSNSNRDRL